MKRVFCPYWFVWFLPYQEWHVGLSELDENHIETNIIGEPQFPVPVELLVPEIVEMPVATSAPSASRGAIPVPDTPGMD